MKRRPWLPPLLWAGVILFVTSLPSNLVPRNLGPFDKAIHFCMYGVLGALATLAVTRQKGPLRIFVLIVIAIAAFGAADEWHQRFIPGRSTELADWIADSLGGLCGIVIAAIIAARRTRQAIA